MSFEDFKLHPSIMSGVQALGYVTPTPIQEKAIPPIMQGLDIIGLAQTGTGKTAAFVLPILQRLLKGRKGHTGALIVSPTRELAEQTYESIQELGQKTGLRCIAVYGGVSMFEQTRKLRSGVEIIVACPGRLLDHLLRGNVDLSHLEILVIDEADRMFDMGFLPDVRSILKCIINRRQTLLFSATMPDDVRKLVKEVLQDPVTIQIGRTAPAVTVSHAIYPVKQHLKTPLLMKLLGRLESDSVLVFTRTKHRAEKVAEQLDKAGYNVASLQGNMSQYQRHAALDGFRNGEYKILVATDLAARGLDILSISHVINYDMPETTDDYTHRIGRTGRVNKAGDAFTFVTGEDMKMVHSIEDILKASIERRTLEGFDYQAPGLEERPNRFFRPQQRRRTMSRPTARAASRTGR